MSEQIAVLIDPSEKRVDLPDFNDGPCPKCGGETKGGFGLAGGGFGPYTFCETCGEVVSKSTIDDDAA